MAKITLALFQDRDIAEHAINALQDVGYNPKEMSLIMKSRQDADYLSRETGADVTGGTTSGATTGGLIGGIAGLLIGIGAITIPGIGALLIAGPVAAALGLTGAAATTVSGALTGALAGGLIGALVGLGVPKEEAAVYETGIKEGGIFLAVPVRASEEDEVREILETHNTSNIRTITMADLQNRTAKRDDTYFVDSDEETVFYTEADTIDQQNNQRYKAPAYTSRTTRKRS